MQAAVYHGPRDIRVEDIPTPSPADNEVLVRVRACGMYGVIRLCPPDEYPGLHKTSLLAGPCSKSVAGAYYGAQLGSPEDPATAAHNVEIVAT